jgi:hypothetical protein
VRAYRRSTIGIKGHALQSTLTPLLPGVVRSAVLVARLAVDVAHLQLVANRDLKVR